MGCRLKPHRSKGGLENSNSLLKLFPAPLFLRVNLTSWCMPYMLESRWRSYINPSPKSRLRNIKQRRKHDMMWAEPQSRIHLFINSFSNGVSSWWWTWTGWYTVHPWSNTWYHEDTQSQLLVYPCSMSTNWRNLKLSQIQREDQHQASQDAFNTFPVLSEKIWLKHLELKHSLMD